MDTVSHVGIFDPALWTVAPLPFSLVQLYPTPPFPVWICKLYTRTQCVVRGGGLLLSLWQKKHLPQSPFTGQYFRWRHFALPSMRLILLRTQLSRSEKKTVWRNCSRKCMKGGGGGGGEWPHTFRQWQAVSMGGMTLRIKIRKKAAGSSGPVCSDRASY
jgi:hypothetical protein